jgi:hypothetical protein
MFSSAWVSPDRIDLKDEKILKKIIYLYSYALFSLFFFRDLAWNVPTSPPGRY